MRILIASTAFPDVARLLAERLPDDEIVVDRGAAGGRFEVVLPLMTRVGGELMDRFAPRLIQQFGVGLEGVDRDAARERGIVVANVPAAGTGNSEGVGEIAVLHLLALLRRYPAGIESVGSARLGEPLGSTLLGGRVVVLGLGDVGRAVCERLTGFGCELVGVGTRSATDGDAACAEMGLAAYRPVAELTDALAGARALVVCCVLNDATRGLVGERELAALGPHGVLVNVARGPIVDYDALLAALRGGLIGGAGLDVYWQEPIDPADPLLALEGVVSVSPHVGGVTEPAYATMADRVVANIERLRRGESVPEAR